MKIEIYDVLHKSYRIPDDDIYIPIQTGCAMPGCKILGGNIIRDDTGDNISNRNMAYNILCPMYWIWKNSKADYVGIVHYRRLFCLKKHKSWEDVLISEQAHQICRQNNIIFPKKRRYPFFTLKTHYIYSFKGLKDIHANDLQVLRDVIEDFCPEYTKSYDKVLNRSWGHMFSVYMMRKDYFDAHCEFMFPILEECERRLQGKRKDYKRYIAALAEFLPDIWVEKNGYEYTELPLFMAEEPHFAKKFYLQIKKTFFGIKNPYNYS